MPAMSQLADSCSLKAWGAVAVQPVAVTVVAVLEAVRMRAVVLPPALIDHAAEAIQTGVLIAGRTIALADLLDGREHRALAVRVVHLAFNHAARGIHQRGDIEVRILLHVQSA